MRAFRVMGAALLAAFFAAGCIDVEKVITVAADGSGTVTETVLLTREAVTSLKQIGGQLTPRSAAGAKTAPKGNSVPDEGFQLLDEKKLRAAARSMGKSVDLLSAKKISTPKGEGYTAIYGFADITDLKLDQNPLESMVRIDVGGEGTVEREKPQKEDDSTETITFEFTKGAPARLVVHLPKEAATEHPSGERSDDAMNEQMVQQIIKDLQVRISIKVEGTITETNAQFYQGPQVTLMAIDFNKVLAKPARLKALIRARPRTFEETKSLVKDVQGVKVETKPTVTVQFE